MFKTFKKAFSILSLKEKKKLKLVIILMLFATIFELCGIAILIPLINFLTETNFLENFNSLLVNYFSLEELSKDKILKILFSLIFLVFIVKNTYLALYSWIETGIFVKFRANLGIRLFEKYINGKYSFFLEKNSSEISANIITETAIFGNFFMNFTTLVIESLILFSSIIFLLFINAKITVVLILFITIVSLLFYLLFKRKVKYLGSARQVGEKKKYESFQRGLTSLKEIIIFNAQRYFVSKFEFRANAIAKIQHQFTFISKLPKLWLETVAILSFGLFFLIQPGTFEKNYTLGLTSIIILVLIKILPSAQKIIGAVQYIKFSKDCIDNLFNQFNEEKKHRISLDNEKDYIFNEKIEFKNVSFFYDDEKKHGLENINLTINKSDKIGIIGQTGSGKSTLINLFTSLINPSDGYIKIDKLKLKENSKNWLNSLGYVSQSNHVFEGTIFQNIALGFDESEVDKKKIMKVINKSCLSNFYQEKNGLDFTIDENGKNISGGEKQRICIARALYKNPEILILDEATSSLDAEVEKQILKNIFDDFKLKTVIFISHKPEALKQCNKIYEIRNKKISRIR